jgi:hypothetical protein
MNTPIAVRAGGNDMSLLSAEYTADLLMRAEVRAELEEPCRECGQHIVLDYCRTCDDFYWIHQPDCSLNGAHHEGHMLTLVPFVEDGSK